MYANAAQTYEGQLMEKKKGLSVLLRADIYDDFKEISKERGLKLTEAIRRHIYEEVEKARIERAREEAIQAGKPVTKVVL